MVELLASGIEGLDHLLGGGFIKKRHTVVSGGPGSGKTTLAYEFLYRGAEKYGQKGLFVSLEQSPERVVEGAKALFNKWDWDRQLGGNIIVTKVDIDDFNNVTKLIQGYVKENNIERVVLDSLTLLKLYFRDENAYRKNLYEFLTSLAKLNCTSLLTLEKSHSKRGDAFFDIEEFIADGVIELYYVPQQKNRIRIIEVIKMRDLNHSSRLASFKITPDGIQISPESQVFSTME